MMKPKSWSHIINIILNIIILKYCWFCLLQSLSFGSTNKICKFVHCLILFFSTFFFLYIYIKRYYFCLSINVFEKLYLIYSTIPLPCNYKVKLVEPWVSFSIWGIQSFFFFFQNICDSKFRNNMTSGERKDYPCLSSLFFEF